MAYIRGAGTADSNQDALADFNREGNSAFIMPEAPLQKHKQIGTIHINKVRKILTKLGGNLTHSFQLLAAELHESDAGWVRDHLTEFASDVFEIDSHGIRLRYGEQSRRDRRKAAAVAKKHSEEGKSRARQRMDKALAREGRKKARVRKWREKRDEAGGDTARANRRQTGANCIEVERYGRFNHLPSPEPVPRDHPSHRSAGVVREDGIQQPPELRGVHMTTPDWVGPTPLGQLPLGWNSKRDVDSGLLYYWHDDDPEERTWDHPQVQMDYLHAPAAAEVQQSGSRLGSPSRSDSWSCPSSRSRSRSRERTDAMPIKEWSAGDAARFLRDVGLPQAAAAAVASPSPPGTLPVEALVRALQEFTRANRRERVAVQYRCDGLLALRGAGERR